MPLPKKEAKYAKKKRVHRKFVIVATGNDNKLRCEEAVKIATAYFGVEWKEEPEPGIWIVWDQTERI